MPMLPLHQFLGCGPIQDFVGLLGARLKGGVHNSKGCASPGPFDHDDSVAVLEQVFEISGSEDRIHEVPLAAKPVAQPQIGSFFPAEIEQIGDDIVAVPVKDGKGAQIRRVLEEDGQWFTGGSPSLWWGE